MWPKTPRYITWGVFQLNETMFCYNDCVLKGFLPLHCRPLATRGAPHILFPMSVTASGFTCTLANLFTSGESCLGENCLRGKRTRSCLSPLCEIQKLLHLVYSVVRKYSSLLWKCLRKRVWTTFMLIKTGNVLRWCVSNQMPPDGCSEMSLLCCLPLSN